MRDQYRWYRRAQIGLGSRSSTSNSAPRLVCHTPRSSGVPVRPLGIAAAVLLGRSRSD